jgi:hypothetical protein
VQRLVLLLGAILIAMLAAGSAGAGVWWTSQYDLTGSQSNIYIYDPLTTPAPDPPPDPWVPGGAFATFTHPLTGNLTVMWGAATASAPITQGRLIGGDTHVDQYANALVFLLTGVVNTVMLPSHPGDAGAISGQEFLVGLVSDTDQSGYIHCTAGMCALGGMTISVPKPLTPTGPHPWSVEMPTWTFSGTGGVGASGAGFVAQSMIEVIPSNPPVTPYTNVVQTLYVGSEISRVPEPASTAMLLPGIGLLGVLAWSRSRLRRR